MKRLAAVTAGAALALTPTADAHDLTSAQRDLFAKRLHKSRTVIAWWNGRGRWALFTRHDHCWQVRVSPRHRRICLAARHSLIAHRHRIIRLERLLAPPPPAAPVAPAPAVDGCLSELIQRESQWNVTATNPTTGAYGLPQALPGSKMASAGPDWATNPATQIRWMLGYVAGRYGSTCAALSFQTANGYY